MQGIEIVRGCHGMNVVGGDMVEVHKFLISSARRHSCSSLNSLSFASYQLLSTVIKSSPSIINIVTVVISVTYC